MESLYNVLQHLLDGNLNVPDGKIDTLHYGYPTEGDYSCVRYRLCKEHIDYESDYMYEEMYQGITNPGHFWLDIDLFNNGLMKTEEKINKKDHATRSQEEHDCMKNLKCIRAGMFVSYYECRICGKEFRLSDPVD